MNGEDSLGTSSDVAIIQGPSHDELKSKLKKVRENRVRAAKTRKSYKSSINHFKWWLRDCCEGNYRFLLAGFENYDAASDTTPNLNTADDKSRTPKLFQEVTILHELLHCNLDAILLYIAWKQEYQESKIGSLRTTRSAFMWFFKEHKLNTVDFEATLSEIYSGLQRTDAASRAAGNSDLKEGKDPLPFSLYRWLSKYFLTTGRAYDSSYGVLTWNLMCRTNNTAKIMLDHMNWENDALIIFFAVTKTDQNNKHPKDPKHIYANPFMPEICPILHLGIYLMLAGRLKEKLYDGNACDTKFSEALRRAITQSPGREKVAQNGLQPKDLGTHSYRKGSTTYVANGDVSGPSISAICLRAGWSMGGVQDRYLRYENAADCYTGRVVSGLKRNTIDFQSLPPHFDTSEWSLTDQHELLSKCFVSSAGLLHTKPNLVPILFNCLASIVYHSDWLCETLPSGHALFQAGVFQHGLVDTLKSKVLFGMDSNIMTTTGIPPHIHTISQLTKTIQILSPNGSLMEEFGKIMTTKLQEHTAAPISSAQMQEALTSCLQSNGVLEAINSNRSRNDANTNEEITDSNTAVGCKDSVLFYYNGSFNVLPENFRLPTVPTSVAWSLWWNGNKREKYIPIRKIKNGMLKTKERKVLTEWRYLFGLHFEVFLKKTGKFVEKPSAEEISEMYRCCQPIMDKVCEARKRKRENQLAVRTVAKRLRRYNKEIEPILESIPDNQAVPTDVTSSAVVA